MAVMVDGEVPEEVTPKDLILALISEILFILVQRAVTPAGARLRKETR